MAAKKKASRTTKARSTTKTSKAPAKKVAAKRAAAKPARAKAARREGLSLTSAVPGFTVNDVEKSLSWYQDVLRFAVRERWESDGKLQGAELVAGSVSFMIGQDDWKKGRDRIKGEGVRIYCATDEDIDRLAAAIKARGGTLAQEPKNQPWGMRDLALDDPDGYKITIAAEVKKR